MDIRSLSSLLDDANAGESRDAKREPEKPSPRVQLSSNPPDPYAEDPKWPAWKVTIGVILFCGAFWAGISYLVSRLFG